MVNSRLSGWGVQSSMMKVPDDVVQEQTMQGNSPKAEISRSDRLIDLLVGHHGSSDALTCTGGQGLCYADLAQQVDYVGRVLRANDVGVGDRVATVLPNGPCMASAFLGVAAYSTCAPLNPQFSETELDYYFSDLDAAAIIVPANVDTAARKIAQRSGIKILDLEAAVSSSGVFQFSGFDAIPDVHVQPATGDDVALILHTSGTTSRPKMVPLTHRNLCASATAIAKTLQLTSDDVCLNMMPLFHIHGLVGVLLSSVAAGASVICAPGFNGDQFRTWLKRDRPSWYSAVPTIHQSVLETIGSGLVPGDHTLRFIRSSSSALSPVVMSKLEQAFGVPVIESYGMTEASHQMASNPLPPGQRKPGSVGMAAGPAVAIMDESGGILARGEVGEIVIRGPSVTMGYVNNTQANEAAFTNGWFRTGDQGFLDSDDYVYITGRLKEIINRAGEKVSPREVDEVLLENDSISQAVTFAMPHPTLGEDVVAAVVLRQGCSVSEADLRAFVFSRLVPAKVPTQILIVPTIPKGPTGKIQRIGLHEKLGHLLRRPFVAAGTAIEKTLVSWWCELLSVDAVGLQDNFFMLGGDSLRAMRLMARIQDELFVELSVAALFRQPTVEQFARVIEQAQEDRTAALAAYVDQLSDEEVEKLLSGSSGLPHSS